MVAYSLTKALTRVLFERFRDEMMIFDQTQIVPNTNAKTNFYQTNRNSSTGSLYQGMGRHAHGPDRAHIHEGLIQGHHMRRVARSIK